MHCVHPRTYMPPLSMLTYSNIAFLLSFSESLDRRLLYSVSQLPVKEFRELSISLGIDCWHWLIASREDLEYRVCERRVLLFSCIMTQDF